MKREGEVLRKTVNNTCGEKTQKDVKRKSNPYVCGVENTAIYSQRLGHGAVFHLETHKVAGSSKQQLPQPGVCGPVCSISFLPSLHVCWQANDLGQTLTFTHQRLHAFPYLTSGALHMVLFLPV